MELEHKLRLKIDSTTGLIGLALVLLAVVVLGLGTVALTRGRVQEGGPEVALRVGPRHSLDDPQQGGVEAGPDGRRRSGTNGA